MVKLSMHEALGSIHNHVKALQKTKTKTKRSSEGKWGDMNSSVIVQIERYMPMEGT